MEPQTEAPSNIQHANVKARVYVRAKAKHAQAFKCETYSKKETTICFQGSGNYSRVDKTVWNQNAILLPVTLSEDHYSQGNSEQFQIVLIVHQFNKMYTGTFTFMSADKEWLYDSLTNLYHNCSVHHQFELNLVSWRRLVSEKAFIYDDTENVMNIEGHTLQCYFGDSFCKSTIETPSTFVWFTDDFFLIFTLQDFVGRKTEIEEWYWIETDLFLHTSIPKKSDNTSPLVIKELCFLMYMLHMHKIHIIIVFHVSKFFNMLKHSVVNQNL